MNHIQNESTIHNQYENLYRVYSTAKEKINGLKKLKDEISEETYEALYSENKALIDNIEPQLDSIKKEIYTIVANMTKEIKIIKDDINEKNAKIQEFEKLLNANIIDEGNYNKNVAPIKEQRISLQDSLKRKNQEISNLKHAVGSPLSRKDNLKNPSYIKRFFYYLALSQLLCIIFYVVLKVLPIEDYFIISLIATSVAFAIAGILLISKYLFKYIKSHVSHLIFSGVGYIILSVISFAQLFDQSMSGIYFFNLILIWNLSFSVLVLIVGFLRVSLPGYRNYERSIA